MSSALTLEVASTAVLPLFIIDKPQTAGGQCSDRGRASFREGTNPRTGQSRPGFLRQIVFVLVTARTELDPYAWTLISQVMNLMNTLRGNHNTEDGCHVCGVLAPMLTAPKRSISRLSNPEGAPSLSGVLGGSEHVEIQSCFVAESLETMACLSGMLEHMAGLSGVLNGGGSSNIPRQHASSEFQRACSRGSRCVLWMTVRCVVVFNTTATATCRRDDPDMSETTTTRPHAF